MFITESLKAIKLVKQKFKQNFNFIVEQNIGHLSKQDLFIGLMLSSFLINVLGMVLPFTIIQIYDRVIPNSSYNTFAAFMIILFIVLIIEASLKIMRGVVSSSLDVKLGYRMSLSAYKTAVNSDLIEFERDPFSVQVDRFNLIVFLKEYYSGQYLIAICDAPFVIFYFIFFYCIQVYVGLGVTILSLGLLSISYLQASKLKEEQLQKTKETQVISKFLVELLGGVSTIKTLGLEEQMLRRYERLQKNHIQKEFQFIQQRMSSGKNINIVSQIIIIMAAVISCCTIFKNYMTLGGMSACILLAGKIMQPIASLINLMVRWESFSIANKEFNKFINIKAENLENTELDKAKKINIERGEIILKNLNFSYVDQNGNKIPIFENIQFKVPSRKIIAIHGDRLSGKSTLIHILACLFKAEGEMFIDGENINSVDLDFLRRQIAFISQKSTIFQGTILENLTRFSNMELKKVQKICMEIGLHSIISSMPNGYQTMIGVDDSLTRGIKQFIIIAREFIKDPKIILFDETNMDLDLEIDVVLHRALNVIKGRITLVMATSRPSLLLMADQHYLIKSRKIIPMESNIK
ncbi:MAG: ATP-binding cassette domain-containing protein [Gammaproteobacteria bacterium]